MKKILYTLAIVVLPIVSQAQISSIQAILDSVNIDTLMFRTEELSGERAVYVNGAADTIFSRNRNRPGNELAFKFIRNKLISYGYQVDSASFGAAGGKNIWAKNLECFIQINKLLFVHITMPCPMVQFLQVLMTMQPV
jgi:hypothetical protein